MQQRGRVVFLMHGNGVAQINGHYAPTKTLIIFKSGTVVPLFFVS